MDEQRRGCTEGGVNEKEVRWGGCREVGSGEEKEMEGGGT